MVGVWEGLNLGSIPNFFLCFGMHPKIIDVYPKLIPKGGVVQFCHIYFVPIMMVMIARAAMVDTWCLVVLGQYRAMLANSR